MSRNSRLGFNTARIQSIAFISIITTLCLSAFIVTSLDVHAVSTVVSYVIYAPEHLSQGPSEEAIVLRQCLSNTELFLNRSVAANPLVDFVFTLVGNTSAPFQLMRMKQSLGNVFVRREQGGLVDLEAHARVIRDNLFSKDTFMLLNCGARGPYYKLRIANPDQFSWLYRFTSKLTEETRAVGATISCEVSPHIQSYAIAVDRIAAQILVELWTHNEMRQASNIDLFEASEVGGSKLLLAMNISIASLDSRYPSRDFRRAKVCDPEYAVIAGNTKFANPVACHRQGDSGCRGVEPCEVVFVKYGGEVLRSNLIAPETIRRVNEEDAATYDDEGRILQCREPPIPLRPQWNVSQVASDTFSSSTDWQNDGVSSMVVLIRVHTGYAMQLLSLFTFLLSLDSSYNLRVIVLPTEPGDYKALVSSLHSLQKTQQERQVRLSFLEVNFDALKEHTIYLRRICSREMRRAFWKHIASRHCNINSPLHYLLVDVVLHKLLASCSSCKQVVVTNADNSYSPGFFAFVNNSHADIAMTNMVHRGYPVVTKPAVGDIDLGTSAVSVNFLRRTGATFLGSLPLRALPGDYHDLDGHFIEHLVSIGATTDKSREYLFTHI